MRSAADIRALAARIEDALPQTQCTRCGYPDCRGYARAIAQQQAPIDRCPPGGAEGIARLAALTGRPMTALDPQCGTEAPRALAVIDEEWCIGCTLCIEACPVDCIAGSHKRMHTVIDALCTGCELCVPVCPVDCIAMHDVTTPATGWAAWSAAAASQARARYENHQTRIEGDRREREQAMAALAAAKLADLERHSRIADAGQLARKRTLVEAAIARARSRAGEPHGDPPSRNCGDDADA
ncbi:MAG: electron transport complex subunit RsxB [Ideonella sp.]|nr:electron transport complex subunit RsxB [Ideonella sp.]MCC7459274.1 electron transport complex subunit RsxB [Nitrospira sp.]